jgi:hypothetical protein
LGGKAIGIFGEVHKIPVKHVDKATTLTPAALLNSILKSKPDVFYDFFLEYHYKHHVEDHTRLAIESFTHLFGNCFQFSEDKCPYVNLRIHSIDYRPTLSIDDFLTEYFSAINGTLTKLIDPTQMTSTRNSIREKVKTALTHPKIIKEIVNIHVPITKYIQNRFIEINIQSNNSLFKYSKVKTMECLQIVYKTIMNYLVLVMDVYALGRIFKTFDTTKNPLHPKVASNCIVYVGELHAEEYVKFLKTYMGVEPLISVYSDSQVLDFTKDEKTKSFLFT